MTVEKPFSLSSLCSLLLGGHEINGMVELLFVSLIFDEGMKPETAHLETHCRLKASHVFVYCRRCRRP